MNCLTVSDEYAYPNACTINKGSQVNIDSTSPCAIPISFVLIKWNNIANSSIIDTDIESSISLHMLLKSSSNITYSLLIFNYKAIK